MTLVTVWWRQIGNQTTERMVFRGFHLPHWRPPSPTPSPPPCVTVLRQCGRGGPWEGVYRSDGRGTAGTLQSLQEAVPWPWNWYGHISAMTYTVSVGTGLQRTILRPWTLARHSVPTQDVVTYVWSEIGDNYEWHRLDAKLILKKTPSSVPEIWMHTYVLWSAITVDFQEFQTFLVKLPRPITTMVRTVND